MSELEHDAQYANADELKMRRLLSWLRENGVTFPSLEIKIVDGLRGVYATDTILAGEMVLHVPRQIMVTSEVAWQSEIGTRLRKAGSRTSDYGCLAAFVLQTKRLGGFWKPFFDVMPTKFPGMPLFYDQRHLRYLKGSHIEQSLMDHKKAMKGDYHVVKQFIENLTLHDFALAYMSVTTRVYKVRVDGYTTLAMVPLADMLNHTSPSPTHWTGRATNGFSIVAVTDLKAGEEVRESYGARSNGRWLLSHGLCMGENPANEVDIELQKIRSRHPFFREVAGLGILTRRRRIFRVTQAYKSDATKKMFTYLRLSCLGDISAIRRTLTKFPRVDLPVQSSLIVAAKHTPLLLPPLSRQNELAALAALAAACRRDMQRYETSLEDDEAVLLDSDLPWTLRFAVMAAASEKRILKHYLDLCTVATEALSSSPFQLARMVSYEARNGGKFADYFRDLKEHLSEFSSLWHVSRLPDRRRSGSGRQWRSVKRVLS